MIWTAFRSGFLSSLCHLSGVLTRVQRWFDFSADDAVLAKEEEEHILTKLHHVLKPFLLRRLKVFLSLFSLLRSPPPVLIVSIAVSTC